MADLNEILKQVEQLSESDIERHRSKLVQAQKYIQNVGTYSDLPTEILDNYLKLSVIVEAHRAKSPNADLSIYDNILFTLQKCVNYIEYISQIEQRSDYVQSMIQSQSVIISDLQKELQEYRGIESAILSNTLAEKIGTVLKKIKL